jgi:hypothetical protein
MIATEVNRLICMSASRENLLAVNTRRQTAEDDRVEAGRLQTNRGLMSHH